MAIFAVLCHNIECGPVKRASAYIAHAGAKESATKFVTGLASEGHRKNLIGRDVVVRDSALNPQGQDVRFARAGGRSHEMAARR
jgi:hypothetical protein